MFLVASPFDSVIVFTRNDINDNTHHMNSSSHHHRFTFTVSRSIPSHFIHKTLTSSSSSCLSCHTILFFFFFCFFVLPSYFSSSSSSYSECFLSYVFILMFILSQRLPIHIHHVSWKFLSLFLSLLFICIVHIFYFLYFQCECVLYFIIFFVYDMNLSKNIIETLSKF